MGSHVGERLVAAGEEVVGLDVYDDFYDPEIKRHNLVRARDHEAFTAYHVNGLSGSASGSSRCTGRANARISPSTSSLT